MKNRRQDRRQEQRENRQNERQTFRRGGTAVLYQMRQKLFAFGQDFYIKNDQGEKVYKVDGKVLRVRDTLYFKDLNGNVICKIQQKLARIRDTMDVDGPNNQSIASVKKALITPLRDRWTVGVGDGPDLNVQGNILDHEYDISAEGKKVAEVSKKWFRIRDTYGVQVTPGQNDAVLLAVTVAIDMMAHEGR
jgi:uncharacterized protein YxjI